MSIYHDNFIIILRLNVLFSLIFSPPKCNFTKLKFTEESFMKKAIIPFLGILAISLISVSAAGKFQKMPTNKYFFIKSVQAGRKNLGYWDQSGRPKRYKKGTGLKVWGKDKTFNRDQQFNLVNAGGNFYYIRSRNGGYIDVRGGKNRNGVRIQVWNRNRSKAQKFRFKHMGNGKWKIYTAWGRILCLKGKKYKNGTILHTWKDHTTGTSMWYFEDARTRKKYEPKKTPQYSRTPDFFIKNKDKAFKYTSSTLVGRNEGTAYVAYMSGRLAYIYVTYKGRNPMNGKMEVNSSVMRIYYNSKDGLYNDGQQDKEFRLEGRPDQSGKRLSMSHSQGGVTLEVTSKSKATAYPKKPDFFINNKAKTFKYINSFMSGRVEGTAKVKSIKGNTITLSITTKQNGKETTRDAILYLKDGVYTYNNKNYMTYGIASARSRKLDIQGEQDSTEFIVQK